MIDSLLSQELYASRFFILGSGEMREAFALRGTEFKDDLSLLKEKAPPLLAARAEPLASLHADYERLFQEGFETLRSSTEAQAELRERARELQDQIIGQLKEIETRRAGSQEERTRRMGEMQRSTFTLMLALSVSGILVGAGAALLITRDIARSIGRLKAATAQLSEGDSTTCRPPQPGRTGGPLVGVSRDEQKLKALEEMKLDSSPDPPPGGLRSRTRCARGSRTPPPSRSASSTSTISRPTTTATGTRGGTAC